MSKRFIYKGKQYTIIVISSKLIQAPKGLPVHMMNNAAKLGVSVIIGGN